jgi:hypothetical protein
MKHYKKRIDENVMITDMRTAGIAILSIKIEIVDVRNMVVHDYMTCFLWLTNVSSA